MPAMYAVEIADRHEAAAEAGEIVVKAVINVHVSFEDEDDSSQNEYCCSSQEIITQRRKAAKNSPQLWSGRDRLIQKRAPGLPSFASLRLCVKRICDLPSSPNAGTGRLENLPHGAERRPRLTSGMS